MYEEGYFVNDDNNILRSRQHIISKLTEARLEKQIIPFAEASRRLRIVGTPTRPEEIGITRRRMKDSVIRAQHIRRRFTILDVAVRTNLLGQWTDAIFGPGGVWEIK